MADIEHLVKQATGALPDLTEAQDEKLLEEIQRRGYLAHKPQPAVKPADFDVSRLKGQRLRLGVISDLHFGSKFQQPTYLVEHLRYMRQQKVSAILVPGDICDGSTKMHPGFEYEIWAHGADAQVKAAADVLVPEAQRLKIPWYLIGGNHDNSFWKTDGSDVVARLCEQSEWFNYLSPGQGNSRNSVGWVRFGRLLVELCHPHMGSAYAYSYRGQKWIEALSSENKPHLVFMGNFHKPLWMEYRNVSFFQLPAFQAQSAWMASKALVSVVGSVIVEVGIDVRGMAPSTSHEFLIERVPKEGDW